MSVRLLQALMPVKSCSKDNKTSCLEVVLDSGALMLKGELVGFNVDNRLPKAGAINLQSKVLLDDVVQRLTSVSESNVPEHVIFLLNSAGADFGNPVEALSVIEQFLSQLTQVKCLPQFKNTHWVAVVPQYLYGGMAITISSCFDTVILDPSAMFGVIGR